MCQAGDAAAAAPQLPVGHWRRPQGSGIVAGGTRGDGGYVWGRGGGWLGGEVAEGRAEGGKGRRGWRLMADGLDVSVGLAVRVCCRMEGAGRRLVAPLHVRSTGVALALAAGRGTPASGGGGRWSPTLRPPSPPAVPVEPSPWTRGVPALHPAGRWARCGWGSTRLRGGGGGRIRRAGRHYRRGRRRCRRRRCCRCRLAAGAGREGGPTGLPS